jgi:hypothetical protein
VAALVEEAEAIADVIGAPRLVFARLTLLGLHGDEAAVTALVESVEPVATGRGEGIALTFCEYARALVYNGVGRYAAALPAAESASARDELNISAIGALRACAHLLYCEWLRREGRRVDAREPSTRRTTCSAQSAWTHSPSARAENSSPPARRHASAPTTPAATHRPGGPDRRACTPGSVEPGDRRGALPQPRNVEWHLHEVFTKLDISSRKELDGALRTKLRQPLPA